MKLTTWSVLLWAFLGKSLFAQPLTSPLSVTDSRGLHWSADGNAYQRIEGGSIVQIDVKTGQKTTLVASEKLIPAGQSKALLPTAYEFSADAKKLLIYTNPQRVWRYATRGDYWVLDVTTGRLDKLGGTFAESSLMFAKVSPDGTKAAYVYKHNLYAEDLSTHKIKPLTTDGTDKIINGTFDWVYEEEFDCRDGFRWSNDSKSIAYWQIDARGTKYFLMINNTDSLYSFTVPVEYPKVGEPPSACKIGVVDVASAKTTWLNVPGDARQHYIPKMEWAGSAIMLQQLNRHQNQSKLFWCNVKAGTVKEIASETSEAWVDVQSHWWKGDMENWHWIENGKAFLFLSEKDGWRHLYRLTPEGSETLITKGDYDVMEVYQVDEQAGTVYFAASPQNATQSYLYRVALNGQSPAERLTPASQKGTHSYDISPNGRWARHSYSSSTTPPVQEMVSLPDHQTIGEPSKPNTPRRKVNTEFFQVTTADGVTMDGWMVKPVNFDSTKKYPVVFMVYGEPASATVRDTYGVGGNRLFEGDMAEAGYIYMSLDNRGTPAPKGAKWRKSIYRNIGIINARDQAMAAKEILKWKFVDSERIAVHGWSGGGSMTLNLLFQYPDIYKTGISVAAVANQLYYDNIYQERYMGLPQENKEDFIKGSPITYAKNLKGNLLYIHGTGDDNVHYQNAEALINELIKQGKQFQMMAYPNRTHGISEGPGTNAHLRKLFTEYLLKHCPPGPR
ncbi:MAG: DPP IV N-terminal domain-containing protein [Spirosomataceae bacterium]